MCYNINVQRSKFIKNGRSMAIGVVCKQSKVKVTMAKRKWDEKSAVKALISSNVDGKKVSYGNSVRGLNELGAIDFLTKQCGYKLA